MNKNTTIDVLLDSLEPINTIEKVDKLFESINLHKKITDEDDLNISMRIRKLSVQQYYKEKKTIRSTIRSFFVSTKNEQTIYSVKYILDHLRCHLYTSDQRCIICGHSFYLGRTYIKDKLRVSVCSNCMALCRKNSVQISEYISEWHRKELEKHKKRIANAKYKKSKEQKEKLITGREVDEEVRKFQNKTLLSNGIFQIGWNEVLFRDGFYILELSNSAKKTLIYRVKDNHSRSAFNNIRSLIEKRLPPLQVEVEDEQIVNVYNKPSLESIISLMEHKVLQSSTHKKKSISVKKERKELNPKEAKVYCKQFKSRYIKYLCDKQLDNYNVVCCIEYRVNSNNIFVREYSFIFTIKETNNLIYLAFENTSNWRCTYLFPIPKETWGESVDLIYEYFVSNEVNKRQQMASYQVDLCLPGNYAYLRVYHKNYTEWVDRIKYCHL